VGSRFRRKPLAGPSRVLPLLAVGGANRGGGLLLACEAAHEFDSLAELVFVSMAVEVIVIGVSWLELQLPV
jgi:hypothetical protein